MHNSQYVTNQLMHGSKYVTNHQFEEDRCWLQSFSVHQHDKDHETPCLQNPITYKRSNFLKRKMN